LPCHAPCHRQLRSAAPCSHFASSGHCHGAALVWHPARQGDRTAALGSCVARRPCGGTSLASPRHTFVSQARYAGISADAVNGFETASLHSARDKLSPLLISAPAHPEPSTIWRRGREGATGRAAGRVLGPRRPRRPAVPPSGV